MNIFDTISETVSKDVAHYIEMLYYSKQKYQYDLFKVPVLGYIVFYSGNPIIKNIITAIQENDIDGFVKFMDEL